MFVPRGARMTIRISRRGSYYGHFRRLVVRLDGVEVARVANGEEVDVEGSGGQQILRLHLDWVASKPVTITDPRSGLVLVEVLTPTAMKGFFRQFWRPRTMIACAIVDPRG
jgi:hypothetical protein